MYSFQLPGTGKIVTSVGPGNDYGRSVVVLPNGKVLLAGTIDPENRGQDFAVVRYNADGTLDTSFGSGGKVTTSFGPSSDLASGLVVQTDGKFLISGNTYNGSAVVFAVARYNADGTLDTSFGSGGKVTAQLGSDRSSASSVALQSDGKILLAGSAVNQTNDFAVARFNTDGTLDTSFGSGGKVTTEIGTSHEAATSVTVQPDGKILLGGLSRNSRDSYDFALVRYNTDGTLDTSFGSGGKIVTAIGSGESRAYGVTVQPDGRILLAGHAYIDERTSAVALVRYNADGTLDTSFGTGGKILTPVGSASEASRALTLQRDGKILLTGESWDGTTQRMVVVRYDTNGALDASFGSNGKVVVPVGSGSAVGRSVTELADGRIVIGGEATSTSNSTDWDFAVVRLNVDGSLDTSFGVSDSLGGSVAYTENASPVVLDADVTVSDTELSAAGSYAGSSLTLARQGGASAQDLFSAKAGGSLGALSEGTSLTYGGTVLGTVAKNSGGVLTLAFSGGTAAQVNAVLREIAYANASDAPPASVVLGWMFSDGNAGVQGSGGAQSATGQTTVLIMPVNDAPVVVASSGSTSAPQQVATVVDAGVSVSDLDSATLASATVSITDGFVSGQDVLEFINTDASRFGNIAGSYDEASGVLSLTSAGVTATAVQFEAALRAVTYQNTSDTPDTGTRTIDVTVDDGELVSAVASRTITVAPVDDASGNGAVLTPVGMSNDYTANINSTDIDFMIIQGFGEPEMFAISSYHEQYDINSNDISLINGPNYFDINNLYYVDNNISDRDGLNQTLSVQYNEGEFDNIKISVL